MRLLTALAVSLPLWAGDPIALLRPEGGVERVPLTGSITVVAFLSMLCLISNEYNDRFSELYRDYSGKPVRLLFVNSNANESAAAVAAHTKAAEYPFTVFKDVNNRLADRLGASLTPEAFVLDAEGRVRYKGQIEDSRNPARTRTRPVRDAIDQLLAGKPVAKTETKAFGCTIKRARKDS